MTTQKNAKELNELYMSGHSSTQCVPIFYAVMAAKRFQTTETRTEEEIEQLLRDKSVFTTKRMCYKSCISDIGQLLNEVLTLVTYFICKLLGFVTL